MKLKEYQEKTKKVIRSARFWQGACLALALLLAFNFFFEAQISPRQTFLAAFFQNLGLDPSSDASDSQDFSDLEEEVLSSRGFVLPVEWGSLGKQMVDSGVIDAGKFEALYNQRGGLDEDAKKLLYGEGNANLRMDAQNSGYLLNLLWALGLANKNPILDEGPMQDDRYGGADRFASTGGWTLSKGSTMDHYSKYSLVVLTQKQQELVERVSKNIYRPCCGNSTYFPDCNHGMAMLGLLELMASQDVSEQEMYRVALRVNSYWFPSTYLTLAKYFEGRGLDWEDVSPKEVLGPAYSSASGYRQILAEVEPPKTSSGPGCGI